MIIIMDWRWLSIYSSLSMLNGRNNSDLQLPIKAVMW